MQLYGQNIQNTEPKKKLILSLNGRMHVKMFGRVCYQEGFWHKGRRLQDHLILFITQGDLKMQIDEQIYPAYAGDILLIPKDIFYKPLASGGCTYCFFHFDAEEAKEKKAHLAIPAYTENATGKAYFFEQPTESTVTLPLHFSPVHRQEIEGILGRALLSDPVHQARGCLVLDLCLREFLACLKQTEEGQHATSRTVQAIIRYIADNLACPLSLHLLSEHFYLSESYIARLFRKELHCTVGEYILKQKIALACALLLNSDIPVAMIAKQIGFSTPYYFSHVFSRQTGLSPTAYRKQNLPSLP